MSTNVMSTSGSAVKSLTEQLEQAAGSYSYPAYCTNCSYSGKRLQEKGLRRPTLDTCPVCRCMTLRSSRG